MSKILKLGLILALVCSALPMGTEVQAKGRCVCPQVYAPVECAKGKVYPNQCVADCRHAKDCVPLDFIAQAEEPAEEPVEEPAEPPVCELEETPVVETSVEASETD